MSDTKKKRSYTKEFKASVLKRLEQPTSDTITGISEELEVPRTTIYQWIRKAETDNTKATINHKPTLLVLRKKANAIWVDQFSIIMVIYF